MTSGSTDCSRTWLRQFFVTLVNICYYMANSVSGQDESNSALWLATRAGKMELEMEKFPRKPHNKSFIDQACSVKMAGYWPRSFFCEFMDLDFVSVNKHAKKERGQYPAILTEQAWSITHIYLPTELTQSCDEENTRSTICYNVYDSSAA